MKKTILVGLALLFANVALAQSWSLSLNNISSGSPNFGTSSNHPINFFTNNTNKMTLTTAGDLKLNRLIGTGNRFVQTDPNGVLTWWEGSFANKDKLLYGDGTWKTAPLLQDGTKLWTGANTSLGIGIEDPLTALHVSGDITTTGLVTAPSGLMFTSADGITYNSTDHYMMLGKGTGGGNPAINTCFTLPSPNIQGWVYSIDYGLATSQSNIGSSSSGISAIMRMFVSPTNGSGYLELDGRDQSNSPSNALYLNYHCGRNTHINTGSQNPGNVYIGSTHFSSQVFMGNYVSTGNFVKMGKHLEIGDPTTGIVNSPNNIALDIHANDGKGVRLKTTVDALEAFAIDNVDPNTALPMKSFLLTGDGKIDITSKNVNDEALVVRYAFSSTYDPTFRLLSHGYAEILPQSANALGVIYGGPTGAKSFNISADGLTEINSFNAKAFSVKNANDNNNETFSVLANGYTEINVHHPLSMPVPSGGTNQRVFSIIDRNANPDQDLFAVMHNGKVYAREVEISLVTVFPDYVFNKDYKLRSIEEVSDFITRNKHLPGFEKGEFYEKNGINVNEMFIKQQEKIEELTLYVIELKKELDAIKKQ